MHCPLAVVQNPLSRKINIKSYEAINLGCSNSSFKIGKIKKDLVQWRKKRSIKITSICD